MMKNKKGSFWTWFLLAIGILVVIGIITNLNGLSITGRVISDNNLQTQTEETLTCNTPYIKVGNSCCLDKNFNNICDKDELTKQEHSNNVWKELYEEACYGKDNLISKSQAENIAKHYAVIQTNNNAKNPISTGDIKTKVPTSTIGEKCNPNWFVQLELDWISKQTNQERTSRYFITVSGKVINETLQGATFLPEDYVFQKVEASVRYHGNSDNMEFIGEVTTHYPPFTNVP